MDYPGFGHSDWPDPKNFAYTFDRIAEIMNHFTGAVGPLPLHRSPPSRCRRPRYRKRRVKSSDAAGLTLMNTGDIFFLYTDGVYSGGDKEERGRLEKG